MVVVTGNMHVWIQPVWQLPHRLRFNIALIVAMQKYRTFNLITENKQKIKWAIKKNANNTSDISQYTLAS